MLVTTYFFAFLFTLIFELVTAFCLGFREKVFFAALVFINGITHPLLWLIIFFIIQPFSPKGVDSYIIFLETSIIIIEYTLLKGMFGKHYRPQKLFLLAFTMNVVSYGGGRVLQYIGIL